jgi:hypothetical protein
LDWPLSKEEKRRCVIQLYEKDVRSANNLLKNKEASIRNMNKELSVLRHRVSLGSESTRSSLEAAQQDSGAELERLRVEMRRAVDEAKMEGVQMVTKVTADHQAIMTDVYAKHSEALSQLRETLSASHKERVDEIQQKHAAKIKDLNESHEARVRETASAHEKQCETLRNQHKAEVDLLQEATRNAAAEHAAAVSKLEEALESERQQLTQERKQSQQLQGELRAAQAAIAELEAKLQRTQEAHAEALVRKEDDFAREKRNIKEQHKAETERLLEVHLKETGELKDQFDRARHLQDMQIEMLQKRIEELQELYDSRPSRDEDLERIRVLEVDVQEKDVQIKKLIEDMQFYKLELVNREQNYNKVFGATPNVGVMNPVATRKSMGAGEPPKMRLVQQPGAGMNMGLPPLGSMVAGNNLTAGPSPGTRKQSIQKRPSSGSLNSRQQVH